MSAKKTLALNLTSQEMAVLEELAAKKDHSKIAVVRFAIRLLQTLDVRVQPGKKLASTGNIVEASLFDDVCDEQFVSDEQFFPEMRMAM